MHADGEALAALTRRVAAALGAARARGDGRVAWDGRAYEHRRMPLGAPSTRDVIADAVVTRGRSKELVRQAEEVRRQSAALRPGPGLAGGADRL